MQSITDVDLHGRAFHDYLSGCYVAPFEYVRDDGHITEYDVPARFDALDRFRPRELRALEHVRGRILDIGCGAGKHALAFQAQGYEAVGIDASALAVEVSRRRGVHRAEIMRAERLEFPPASFDCVTFFSNGLSMGGDAAGVRRILREVAKVTSPDGIVVMENIDVTRAEVACDIAYVAANRARSRPAGEIRLRCRYRGMAGRPFRWLLLEPSELESHLAATNWRLDELDYFAGGSYCAVIVKTGRPKASP